MACAPRSRGEKKIGGGEEERGSWMEKQGASHLCLPVLQPCHHAMLLREEWRGGGCCVHPCACQCVAMSCVTSHAIMMSCLCASVFSSQPSLCVCVCVCVAESTPVQAGGGGAHTPTHVLSSFLFLGVCTPPPAACTGVLSAHTHTHTRTHTGMAGWRTHWHTNNSSS